MSSRNKTYLEIKSALLLLATEERAKSSLRFFKTGKGEYGEGDKFHGISVPDQRKVAKAFVDKADEDTITTLLESDFHEERLTGVFILVQKFTKANKKGAGEPWVKLYLINKYRINNWDLVDSSAHLILGKWLEDKDRQILYELAKEDSLWSNRIAVIATMHFIRKDDFKDIFKLASMLLSHPHDLMHKAIGWMLRETWQRSPQEAEVFINRNLIRMPRTMLRYAIEKMPERMRLYYLNKPLK